MNDCRHLQLHLQRHVCQGRDQLWPCRLRLLKQSADLLHLPLFWSLLKSTVPKVHPSHILREILLILCPTAAGFSEVDAAAEGSADETIVAESEGTTEITGNNRTSWDERHLEITRFLLHRCFFVTGKGSAESGGEAEAFTATLERCSGKYYLCCRERNDTCTCSLTR